MAKILVTHGIPDHYKMLLADHQVVSPERLNAFSDEELRRYVPDADAVLACGAFSARHIEDAKRLSVIANYGAGYEHIDVGAASAGGILVTNTPDETAYPTAEVAIGLLISAMRRIGELNLRVRTETPESLFGMGKNMGMGLYGSTLGIIGMGHIGSIVASFGRLMGMRILYCNRTQAADENGAVRVSLDELMAVSDAVSVHCPLTDETAGLLGADKLRLMKPRSVLVNTARGAIVDYDSLYAKLLENQLFAAGLDVFADEPHIPAKLLSLPNVIITPHIGTNTLEARNAMGSAAASRILEALAGRVPPNVVNPEAIPAWRETVHQRSE